MNRRARAASALAVSAALGAAVWARNDYRKWTDLGVGGLPHTLAGWLSMTRMRLIGGSPFTVPDGVADRSPLSALPDRGTRPRVAPHPVPHRVLEEQAGPELVAALTEVFDRAVQASGGAVVYRTSGWEKHNQALFVAGTEYPHPVAADARGELGHVHPSDGSGHVILHPDDAAALIARGWGELHPLSGKMLRLPPTYMMLYPPRKTEDVEVVARILEAAIAYMSGRREPATTAA